MCKDILIGMAIGVAVGMMVKCAKVDSKNVMDKAKDAVKSKLKDIADKL